MYIYIYVYVYLCLFPYYTYAYIYIHIHTFIYLSNYLSFIKIHPIFLGEKDYDAPDTTSPIYTTQHKSIHNINMSKQHGRELHISGMKNNANNMNNEEKNEINNDIYGFEDEKIGIEIEREKEENIRKAMNSKYNDNVYSINLNKIGRNELDNGRKKMDENDNTIENSIHILDLDMETYDKGTTR